MADISVEEAVAQLEGTYAWYVELGGPIPVSERAVRVVLDELKALQECSSCKCDHANRGNDK